MLEIIIGVFEFNFTQVGGSAGEHHQTENRENQQEREKNIIWLMTDFANFFKILTLRIQIKTWKSFTIVLVNNYKQLKSYPLIHIDHLLWNISILEVITGFMWITFKNTPKKGRKTPFCGLFCRFSGPKSATSDLMRHK